MTSVPLLPLHSVDCRGKPYDVTRMREILQSDPLALDRLQSEMQNNLFCNKTPPLHNAIYHGHINCINFLLESGAKINSLAQTNKDNINCPQTVLDFVYITRTPKLISYIIQILIKNGLAPNEYNNVLNSGKCLLSYAIESDWIDSLKIMLENGAQVDHFYINKNGDRLSMYPVINSPLSTAIYVWNLEICKSLLIHGASIAIACCDPDEAVGREVDFSGNCSFPHFVVDRNLKMENGIHVLSSCANIVDALSALNMYQQFGGNLWIKQDYSYYKHKRETTENRSENILEFFDRKPQISELLKDLYVELNKMMQSPLNLTNLCRIALLKAMKTNYWKVLNTLEIPIELKIFLAFSDVKITPKFVH